MDTQTRMQITKIDNAIYKLELEKGEILKQFANLRIKRGEKMNKEDFLRTLHLMMDKFEEQDFWKYDEYHMDNFYSFCENYGKIKNDVLSEEVDKK